MPSSVGAFPTIFIILWFGICISNILFPKQIWKINQSWRSFREPSKMYFIIQRIMGIIFLLIGLTLILPVWFH